ncbi:hypothetical protein K7X08_013719 [Anisodus acutangulus]|uniref:Uncharacterized protein n=1 Tax=Anisodus acutangulus TaxID=402998 RepID=A0A9Q1R3M0_9SOLA|nr:hypothetical protein K7X08_013719 [Anisodus acutangulus]
MHTSNQSSILVDEGLLRCLEENEDLKGELDVQEREILHLKKSLWWKDEQFIGDLPIVKAEFDRVNGDYLLSMNDLELVIEFVNKENKSLDKKADQLSNDIQNFLIEFVQQEEVLHYQMQKKDFLTTKVDCLTTELSVIDAE